MIKMLALFPDAYFQKKHSPVRRHAIQAIQKHPQVDCVISGQGWDNYNLCETLSENILRLIPDGCDVVWMYKPNGGGRPERPPHVPPLRDWKSVDALKVISLNEFWWDIETRRREVGGFNLAIAHHENDLPRFNEVGIPAVHIPHSANVDVFYRDKPTNDRRIDCLITGSISEDHYPLRCRLRAMVVSGRLPGELRAHPGYWQSNLSTNDTQVKNYADHLGNAKISLCCSSKWKYALGKLVESMQAGCLVVSDMPDDKLFQQTLGKYIVEIDSKMSDGQIVDVVKSWLSRPLELIEFAKAGQKLAISEFSMQRYAERFYDTVVGPGPGTRQPSGWRNGDHISSPVKSDRWM